MGTLLGGTTRGILGGFPGRVLSSVALSIPQKEFLHKEDVDDLVEVSIEHHPSISALPKLYSFDDMDDSQPICLRDDGEGIWIENKSSM